MVISASNNKVSLIPVFSEPSIKFSEVLFFLADFIAAIIVVKNSSELMLALQDVSSSAIINAPAVFNFSTKFSASL